MSEMPKTELPAPKRSYLRPPERRRQLLDATTAVVRRDGLTALTMVAVAAEAGVSRRLVYNHFPDLATLARTFVADRLMTFMADTESEFNSEARSRSAAARSIFVRLSAVPAEDRLLLRTLLVGAGPVELNGIQELIEERMQERWRRMPTDAPDDPLLDARVLIAGQIALTIADLVDRGRLTAEQADRLVREGASLLAK
ncbi:MAG: TetR family transcriptional regulator [Actinobacteria bacterium]|nr:TetR family transcriptional regulator [Actinomycetota bacterium]MSX80021.1 TetR family transcriptional regulator [Actinomycetota bacterium]